MAQQIAEMKLALGYGQYADQTKGTASSGWGLGTSPYAVAPAPAAPNNQVEDRQGDQSLGDTPTTNFEPLYAPTDAANSTRDEQVHGQIDLTQSPKKVEEVRSAPENQQAMIDYANIIGAYAEGEESAVNRESVPLEYQELVKLYFEQLARDAAKKDSGEKNSGSGDESGGDD